TTAYPSSSSAATTSSTLVSVAMRVTITSSPNGGALALEAPDQEVGRVEKRLPGGFREHGVTREHREHGLTDAGLDAVEDREPHRPEGGHVVADLVGEVHHVGDALGDVGAREPGDTTGHRRERVDVGQDRLTTGTHNAGDLAQHRLQLGDVRESERARDDVDARVVEWQLLEPAEPELRGRHLLSGDHEHGVDGVDADHAVAPLGE